MFEGRGDLKSGMIMTARIENRRDIRSERKEKNEKKTDQSIWDEHIKNGCEVAFSP